MIQGRPVREIPVKSGLPDAEKSGQKRLPGGLPIGLDKFIVIRDPRMGGNIAWARGLPMPE